MLQAHEKKSSYKKFPYAIKKIKGVTHNKIIADFGGIKNGLIQVGPEKWTLRSEYETYADEIYNFEARSDDVWICTLPRSGTTWTQEMIWLICNNLDYETALKIPQTVRFPYLELHTIVDKSMASKMIQTLPNGTPQHVVDGMKMWFEPQFERLAAMTTRRFIKTHLPIKLLPHNILTSGARIVYVARNPKDVAVSYYHFSRKKNIGFNGDFEMFAQYFMEDLITCGPYWKHTLDGWNNRHRENVYFVFYEELKFDQESALKKLANFLGHPLNDEDMPKLMDHISFERFKANNAINVMQLSDNKLVSLVRRGKVGGNPEMTEEMSRKFDQWAERNMAGTDLQFPYDF